MIVILHPNTNEQSAEYIEAMSFLDNLPNISLQHHVVQGAEQKLSEIYLLGDTQKLNAAEIESLDCVDRVIRISEEYRILGRHKDMNRTSGFTYNGVHFSQDNFHVLAGLCAVE